MPLTKQDIQSCIDNARIRLQDSVPARQDVYALKEATKSLVTMMQQNQQILRQETNLRSDVMRKLVNLETRLSQLEHDMQTLNRSVSQIANVKPSERVTERVVMASAEERQRYMYNLVNAPHNQ